VPFGWQRHRVFEALSHASGYYSWGLLTAKPVRKIRRLVRYVEWPFMRLLGGMGQRGAGPFRFTGSGCLLRCLVQEPLNHVSLKGNPMGAQLDERKGASFGAVSDCAPGHAEKVGHLICAEIACDRGDLHVCTSWH
jgi:hypothetical protein